MSVYEALPVGLKTVGGKDSSGETCALVPVAKSAGAALMSAAMFKKGAAMSGGLNDIIERSDLDTGFARKLDSGNGTVHPVGNIGS